MDRNELLLFLKVCSKMTINKSDEKLICKYASEIEDEILNILVKHKIHLGPVSRFSAK